MMSMSTPHGRPGWRRRVGYACLLLPFWALLWVPAYARPTPTLVGLPFFYWYQLAWVVLTPALMAIANMLLRRDNSGEAAAAGS